jgi:hypothetical protein
MFPPIALGQSQEWFLISHDLSQLSGEYFGEKTII